MPEDFTRLCLTDTKVPLCDLTDEEYQYVVYGIKKSQEKQPWIKTYASTSTEASEYSSCHVC